MKATNNQLLIEVMPIFNKAFEQLRANKDVKQESYLAFLERPNDILLAIKDRGEMEQYIYGIVKNRKYTDFRKENKYTILGDDIEEEEPIEPYKREYSYQDYEDCIKNQYDTKLDNLNWHLTQEEKELLFDYANYESFRDLTNKYNLTAMGICKRFKKIKFKLCN